MEVNQHFTYYTCYSKNKTHAQGYTILLFRHDNLKTVTKYKELKFSNRTRDIFQP